MDDIYENIEQYNLNTEHKIRIISDEMIPDLLNNKKHQQIVTDSFIIGRKLNISLVFITQSCFAVAKNIGINFRHYFIMEIPSKQELQQIAINHS